MNTSKKTPRIGRRAWDRAGSTRVLLELGVLSSRNSNGFVYDVDELLDACHEFHAKVRKLGRALMVATCDSTGAWEAATELRGEVEHFRYHLGRLARLFTRIQNKTRELPPLNRMTDREFNSWWAARYNKQLKAIWESASKEVRKHRRANVRKRTATSRKTKRRARVRMT